MSRSNNVLAFVMAGGEGSRLHPLTAERCKPAVPFNGKHRIVDFVLSNLINSEIYSVYLLVQYKSQSLIEHIRQSWAMARFIPNHFITVVPPQMRNGPEWFQGTADSVYQNIHLIETFRPDIVAVFGADHIYRMDVRQMIDFHTERRAQVSVATLPVPLSQCNQFGIVETGADQRITGFVEKPAQTRPMPGSETHALASMGNYLFDADVLLEALRRAHDTGQSDFGKHILPAMLESHRLFAYDFGTNTIPGIEAYEERGYWRDVGTIDAYFEAHFDTLGAAPKFRMTNRQWPIYASPDQAESAQIENGVIRRSIVGSGSIVDGAQLDHAMLRRSVLVERDARMEHCIVMERSRVGQGAHIRRAIIDQDNDIPPGERIGVDLAADRLRFPVTDSGIVVVPARFFPPRGTHAAGADPTATAVERLTGERQEAMA
ncbi:MAG: glucose-1-phosphate adenylyltransferase [Hydrogenophaga sp.]|uniref:glucose-1-phosphate adenylyltransferase n=1 Tax=Hydrogenophaga sp. TaxID=1904254 RepID=UPI0016A87FB6|nr:glucose-1-phosphate adenylyltransferase [Hydrogenophaga sp.]NIN25721.1 glucose-1-phosphate adenylyltransferase [Hydrogenophaga sp.]NIN30383.1 glucose-1-phosphate adenylyltransferase [Hydrogenophaga sp.]NIN56723.1 glucose-1-phosphate adenylyltransferase [Hydrogenophaga sp.]NIO53298.1 glucose-1-phosphate adenylyltransferase [Hydrogenophaga sp.]